jgi:single-strand DNA-binding protein
MAGLNRVVLVGRMVRDPELKKTSSGMAYTNITVAVDNPLRNGEKSASFIPCTCWNKTAENVSKFCTKGALIGVDGRLTQRSYKDRDGQNRSVVEVTADNVQFLERKGASGSEEGSNSGYSRQSADTSSNDDHEGIDTMDDGLPF